MSNTVNARHHCWRLRESREGVTAGAGTALLTVSGAISGVKGSRSVSVAAAVITEEYLRIENALSEIANAGKKAQQQARKYLGLGTLAEKNDVTAADVGAAPMAVKPLGRDVDLNTLTSPGDYFQPVSSLATEANNYPESTAGAIRVVRTGVTSGACRQFYWPYNSTKEYRRCGFGEPLVFGAWSEH